MNIKIKKITSGSDDRYKVDELNCEAFPKAERIPTEKILGFADRGDMDCLAFYDDEIFVGFAVVMEEQSFVYMSFFAVESDMRSRGYGSGILALINEYFNNKQLVLDIEPVVENAPNLHQRKIRRSFYMRNGLKPSGYFWCYSGMVFELLCSKLPFDADKFAGLVEKFRSKEFNPIIFKG